VVVAQPVGIGPKERHGVVEEPEEPLGPEGAPDVGEAGRERGGQVQRPEGAPLEQGAARAEGAHAEVRALEGRRGLVEGDVHCSALRCFGEAGEGVEVGLAVDEPFKAGG